MVPYRVVVSGPGRKFTAQVPSNGVVKSLYGESTGHVILELKGEVQGKLEAVS